MPSVDDVFNAIQGVNTRLDTVNSQLVTLTTSTDAVKTSTDAVKTATDGVKAAVQQVNATLSAGFGQLITLGVYTNKALFHNSKQNETIICLLEQISDHTCRLLNESHIQTGLQTSIEKSATMLADLYASTHADAALARERTKRCAGRLKSAVRRRCRSPSARTGAARSRRHSSSPRRSSHGTRPRTRGRCER